MTQLSTPLSTPAPGSGPLTPAGPASGGISSDSSRLKSDANLKKAGEQFEAVFTGMMLKSMRQAKLTDPLFDSKALDTFTEMQDAQTAKSMAEHTPLGIGKAMTDFLSKSVGATPDFLAKSKANLNSEGASSQP